MTTPGAGSGARELSADQLSLARRLRQPRTIASLLVPIVLLVLIVINLRSIDGPRLVDSILHANPLLLGLALLVYYAGFPLRGERWRHLLRGIGVTLGRRDSTEIVFISWLVNCLVPAKLGDVYRAYLLRLNYPVSLSRTLGTLFVERVFDLFAIVILGLAAGFWSFRDGLSGGVKVIFVIGVVVVVVLAVLLFTLRNFGRRLVYRLSLPRRVLELYDRFEEGVFALPRAQVPRIGMLTAFIWSTEAVRLLLVVAALGFADVHMGISGAFFVALSASLLTAVPLTPAGLGVVEAGMVGVLTLVYRIPFTEASAIALVDRAISVLTVIALGSLVYVVSDKTKGMRGLAPAGPVAAGGSDRP